MMMSLRHRGPDGNGLSVRAPAAFSHTRLAILDLTPGGAQPMVSPDSRYMLTFNGEIYNYRELRQDLRKSWTFRSTGDAEVLLAAWSEYGPECVDRFRGMFAFAIWDDVEQQLHLVRDRFGIKPLYYSAAGGRVVFASELAALAAGGVSLTPCPSMVGAFLRDGFVGGNGSATFFHGAEQVPAGSRIVCGPGPHLVKQQYYQLSPQPSVPPDAEQTFLDELKASVGFHLRSDVPIGSCLSGGIDSSALVALCNQQLQGVGSQFVISAGSLVPELDETAYARYVADVLKIDSAEVVPTAAGLVADMPRLVRAQGEPFPGSGIYAQWCVMRVAAEHGLKVMIDGQGADELLGGYSRHRLKWVSDRLEERSFRKGCGALLGVGAPRLGVIDHGRRRVGRIARALCHWEALDHAADGGDAELRSACQCGTPVDHLEAEDGWDPSRFTMERLGDIGSRTLPGILRYEDRNSMAFGVEARCPSLITKWSKALSVSMRRMCSTLRGIRKCPSESTCQERA